MGEVCVFVQVQMALIGSGYGCCFCRHPCAQLANYFGVCAIYWPPMLVNQAHLTLTTLSKTPVFLLTMPWRTFCVGRHSGCVAIWCAYVGQARGEVCQTPDCSLPATSLQGRHKACKALVYQNHAGTSGHPWGQLKNAAPHFLGGAHGALGDGTQGRGRGDVAGANGRQRAHLRGVGSKAARG